MVRVDDGLGGIDGVLGTDVLRPHAEIEFAHELAALVDVDTKPRPPRWVLSPWAVVTYLTGGTLPNESVGENV